MTNPILVLKSACCKVIQELSMTLLLKSSCDWKVVLWYFECRSFKAWNSLFFFRNPNEKAGYGFQAFATDTSGVLSPSSYLYLCRIATSYAAIANRPYAYALSLCLRRVSFAIQKGLAYQLTSSPSMPTNTEDVFDLSWLSHIL
mgnify:CR=1 FL=1